MRYKIVLSVAALAAALILTAALSAAENPPAPPTSRDPSPKEPAVPAPPADKDASAIAKAVENLGSASEKERWKAHDDLVKFGEAAVKPISEIFGIGVAAKEEAKAESPDARLAKLVEMLGSDSYREREAATEELTKIGKPAADALQEALKSGDPEVRQRASKILSTIRNPGEDEAVKKSRENLKKYMAVLTLEDIGSKNAKAALMKAVEEDERLVAASALGALAWTGCGPVFTPEELEASKRTVLDKLAAEPTPSPEAAENAVEFKPGWKDGEIVRGGVTLSAKAKSKLTKAERGDQPEAQRGFQGGVIIQTDSSGGAGSGAEQNFKFELAFTDTIKKTSAGEPVEFERSYTEHKEETAGRTAAQWQGFGVGGSSGSNLKDALMVFRKNNNSSFHEIEVKKGDASLEMRMKLALQASALCDLLPPGRCAKKGDKWKLSEISALFVLDMFDSIEQPILDARKLDAECMHAGKAKFRGKECARVLMRWNLDFEGTPGDDISVKNNVVVMRAMVSGIGSAQPRGKMRMWGEYYYDLESGRIVSIELFGAGYHRMISASAWGQNEQYAQEIISFIRISRSIGDEKSEPEKKEPSNAGGNTAPKQDKSGGNTAPGGRKGYR
jgi:hypothetical protein